MTTKTYAEMYFEREQEEFPEVKASMALYNFINDRYHEVKGIADSILREENFENLSPEDVNPDLAWLIHNYVQIDGFEEDAVKFAAKSPKSEEKRYSIPVASFAELSDEDFAAQVRHSLKNPSDVKGHCTRIELWGKNVSKEALAAVIEALGRGLEK